MFGTLFHQSPLDRNRSAHEAAGNDALEFLRYGGEPSDLKREPVEYEAKRCTSPDYKSILQDHFEKCGFQLRPIASREVENLGWVVCRQ